MKFAISAKVGNGDDDRMALGAELLCDSPPPPGARPQCLLLNPRLPAEQRNRILRADFPADPHGVWLATSGTGGSLKIVALSHDALETSARAVNARLAVGPGDVWLNPLPLFHVGGLGIVIRASLAGNRCEPFPEWNPALFARRAEECSASLTSLVPAQVHDLVSARIVCPVSLRAAVVGGGVLDESLRLQAAALGWPLIPSYGLTEASSQVATGVTGSHDAAWLPLLEHLEARVGDGDVLELRGRSLLSGWMIFAPDGSTRWEDPKVDGWFRTSDRCRLRDGRLRFVGRLDDLVKIRGELVDVAALERELQKRVSSALVRVDVEPDTRNGFVLVVVAGSAPAQAEAREAVGLFPPYARPVDFRVGPVEVGPLGKKIRTKNAP